MIDLKAQLYWARVERWIAAALLLEVSILSHHLQKATLMKHAYISRKSLPIRLQSASTFPLNTDMQMNLH